MVLNNTICKVVFNLHVDGNDDGLTLQQEVSDWCRNILEHSIDLVMEDYHQVEEVISIDNLRLDIDLERTEAWEIGLAEKIIQQFKEKLQSKIHSKAGDVKAKSRSANFSEILVYFLKHGILPWHSSMNTRNDFEIVAGKWLKNISPEEIRDILLNLRDEISIARFVDLLREDDIVTFIVASSGNSKDYISSLFENAKTIINTISDDKILQQRLKKTLKKMIISSLGRDHSQTEIIQALKNWITDINISYPDRIQNIRSIKHVNKDIFKVISDIQEGFESEKKIRGKEHRGKSQIKPKRQITKGEVEVPKNRAKKPVKAKDEFKTDHSLKKIGGENFSQITNELTEGVYINNAGAVIIVPFLSTLFSRTRLLNENIITDKAIAVTLFHYCITGNTNPAEFELLLPKIFCGIDPDTYLDTEIFLDEMKIKEADKMLASVIEYWGKLKDTSIDGLRENFLKRNGKLSFLKDKWKLQVEHKSFDMLLQNLPWSISMIKLPWMKYMLYVEWS